MNLRRHRFQAVQKLWCAAAPWARTWRTPACPCTTWRCRAGRPPDRRGRGGRRWSQWGPPRARGSPRLAVLQPLWPAEVNGWVPGIVEGLAGPALVGHLKTCIVIMLYSVLFVCSPIKLPHSVGFYKGIKP